MGSKAQNFPNALSLAWSWSSARPSDLTPSGASHASPTWVLGWAKLMRKKRAV